ncbi:tyrosine-type recombinase/integrase [Tunturiibacter gelidiferens]|uniref:tyrosine-type recombinase/integrase n=1 Tax=Tunturiibacter gelidiferens TaxID=3069689 RepID=UPI003D9B5EBE
MQGKRARLRLLEKGNKEKLVWLHHEAEEFLDAYLEMPNITDNTAPLFQTQDKNHRLTGLPLSRRDMMRIVKGRCAAAGLPDTICNHTFRGTGITVFLQNGGSLEAAQDMANHSDPRITKLYDRRKASSSSRLKPPSSDNCCGGRTRVAKRVASVLKRR